MDVVALFDLVGAEIGTVTDGRVYAGTGSEARMVGRLEEDGGVVAGLGGDERFIGSVDNDGRVWAGSRGKPEATVGFVGADGSVRRGRDRQTASRDGAVRPASFPAGAALLLLVAHEPPEEMKHSPQVQEAGAAIGSALGVALARLVQRKRAEHRATDEETELAQWIAHRTTPTDPEEIFRRIRALVGPRPVDGDAGLRRAYTDGILDLHELQEILSKYEITHYLIEHGLWKP